MSKRAPKTRAGAIPDIGFHDRVVREVFPAAVAYGKTILSPIDSTRQRIWQTRQIFHTGDEHLRNHQGPGIISMVHRSMLDPLVMSITADQVAGMRINMMAKKELGKIPFLERILNRGGTFLVDRDGGMTEELVDKVDDILANDGMLGLYPERHRREGDAIDFKHLSLGVAAFALRSGAPIIPVGISGTHKTEFGPVAIAVGEPIAVEPVENFDIFDPRQTIRLGRPLLREVYEQMQVQQDIAIALRPAA